MSASATRYRVFAAVSPGLEPLLASELERLGLPAEAREAGGVEVSCPQAGLFRLAVEGRLAESLRVRVGRPFEAQRFDQLMERAARLPWAAFVARGSPLPRVKVACHRSRLYHQGAVAQRLEEMLSAQLGCTAGEPRQTVFARLDRDRVQLSIDASGDLLHRRGYRTHLSEAPLRETLAAACLEAAGYLGDRPLWDPFCGAGTIPLEALLVATGTAPGVRRDFGFQLWPTFDAAAFAEYQAALPAPAPPPHPVIGSDLSPGALRAAAANAGAADLSAHLTLLEGDFEAVAPRIPEGTMLVTNPPYGHRSGGPDIPRTFARLGDLLRHRPDLRPALLLAGHLDLERQVRLPFRTLHTLTNRGLPARLMLLG